MILEKRHKEPPSAETRRETDELPLHGDVLAEEFQALANYWSLRQEHHIEKTFLLGDFHSALHFVNRIGAVAQTLQHHPHVELSWGKVKITLWTDRVDGLTKMDFALARKIDESFLSCMSH